MLHQNHKLHIGKQRMEKKTEHTTRCSFLQFSLSRKQSCLLLYETSIHKSNTIPIKVHSTKKKCITIENKIDHALDLASFMPVRLIHLHCLPPCFQRALGEMPWDSPYPISPRLTAAKELRARALYDSFRGKNHFLHNILFHILFMP